MSKCNTGELRNLPSVDNLLNDQRIKDIDCSLSREVVIDVVRRTMAEVRREILDGEACSAGDEIIEIICNKARKLTQNLRKVINATGVILHTNLGRAPLSDEAIEAMDSASVGYVDLEIDLDSGKRGSRLSHVEMILSQLSGAEAAMIVNNNASAVLLGLAALAKGKEVIVSRGQAVQIGGGFRIPDVMRQSGVKLVEVGTTNFCYLTDYEQAITPRTHALLMVHSSNFKVVGFTQGVALTDVARLAEQYGLVLLDDLGSGCFIDTSQYGLDREPMVQESVSSGSSLTFFSGDKLLGGPQAGLIVGNKALIDKLKKHPLARAVRIDKTRLAGLIATLAHYIKGEAESKIPVWRMISVDLETLEGRVHRWLDIVGGAGSVEASESVVGGGSLPGGTLPTHVLAIKERAKSRDKKILPELARRLRIGEPSILCRIERDRLLLDPRTVLEEDDEALLERLRVEIGELFPQY
ncbi:L-seryl-tRNA(Sec) selenium transferase [Chloroflexota bacterium]